MEANAKTGVSYDRKESTLPHTPEACKLQVAQSHLYIINQQNNGVTNARYDTNHPFYQVIQSKVIPTFAKALEAI